MPCRRNLRVIPACTPQTDELKRCVVEQGIESLMPSELPELTLNESEWYATPEQVAEELTSFVIEFDAFTPEWFAEVKFHLLKKEGLTQETRDELCEVAIHYKVCPKCNYLYKAKQCLLWYRLFKLVTWNMVERAPPCIRYAYAKKNIKTVANYFSKINLISPPFYQVRSAPSCRAMQRWGYCKPDDYCNAMERENTLYYNAARDKIKISKDLSRE